MTRLDTMRPFGFVSPGHPLRGDLERFWSLLGECPAFAAQDASGSTVRSGFTFGDAWPARRTRATVSVQRWDEGVFTATTFRYRARRGRLEVFEFPDDPRLSGFPRFAVREADVLQYVPLGRMFKRDRFTEDAFDDGLERVERLTSDVASRLGGRRRG